MAKFGVRLLILGVAYAPETLLTWHRVYGLGGARIRLRANAPFLAGSMPLHEETHFDETEAVERVRH